jgi:hypothetical protein
MVTSKLAYTLLSNAWREEDSATDIDSEHGFAPWSKPGLQSGPSAFGALPRVQDRCANPRDDRSVGEDEKNFPADKYQERVLLECGGPAGSAPTAVGKRY